MHPRFPLVMLSAEGHHQPIACPLTHPLPFSDMMQIGWRLTETDMPAEDTAEAGDFGLPLLGGHDAYFWAQYALSRPARIITFA